MPQINCAPKSPPSADLRIQNFKSTFLPTHFRSIRASDSTGQAVVAYIAYFNRLKMVLLKSTLERVYVRILRDFGIIDG